MVLRFSLRGGIAAGPTLFTMTRQKGESLYKKAAKAESLYNESAKGTLLIARQEVEQPKSPPGSQMPSGRAARIQRAMGSSSYPGVQGPEEMLH